MPKKKKSWTGAQICKHSDGSSRVISKSLTEHYYEHIYTTCTKTDATLSSAILPPTPGNIFLLMFQ